MKKVSFLAGLLLVVAMLSGCAEFDQSSYRSDQYDNGHSGHSHH
ncbi:hypothetical protein [Geobacter argillaceus]|nr:hypothetical protein [Geobacter argillaceus]